MPVYGVYSPFMRPWLCLTGVPADNSTFFCNYARVRCYSHSFKQDGHRGAEQDCAMLGGELVQFRDASEQQLVEQVGLRESVKCAAGCH
jgi:hypothetical protein